MSTVFEVLAWVALAFVIAGVGGAVFAWWWRGEIGVERTYSDPVVRGERPETNEGDLS